MADVKPILKISTQLQAVALLKRNIKGIKQKGNAKNILKRGTENILGSSLIKIQDDLIESL